MATGPAEVQRAEGLVRPKTRERSGMNYDRRLERLEQATQPDADANLVVGFLEPGQVKAAKVSELRRVHGICASRQILLVAFCKADDSERPSAQLTPNIDRNRLWANTF